jgi:hypothetical protein
MLPTINVVNKHVMLRYGARQFKVGISDGPSGVVTTDQLTLNGERKWGSPQQWDDGAVLGGDKEYSSHARGSSVGSANTAGGGVHDFAKAGRPGMEISDNPLEVIQKAVHVRCQANAAPCLMPKCFLEEAKEASESRNRKDHAAKLTNDLLPAFGGDTCFLPRELIQDGNKMEEAARGKLEGVFHCVDHPSEQGFGGFP